VSATATPGARGVAPAAPGTRVVRLGAVSYLNSEPHVYGLDRDAGFRLEREVPSRVARRLHAGEVDLGLVPSIEYAFGDYAIVPGVAIGSRGKVRSVLLFHHGPLERVRRVALDRGYDRLKPSTRELYACPPCSEAKEKARKGLPPR